MTPPTRRWVTTYRLRRQCFHHDRGSPANNKPATSWLRSQLVDTGMRKMFWCTRCGRTWFT